MRIDGGFDYPGAKLADVFAMLTDPVFQRERCEATGALETTVDISGDPAAPIVKCRRRLATVGLPDFVRKVVGSSIEITDEVRWRPETGPNREADVRLVIVGQPTKMAGELHVRDDGQRTQGALAAELKAGVPFLGTRIEKATAPLIIKAMAIEQTVGRQWLTK